MLPGFVIQEIKMEIVEAYRTNKGLFFSKDIAYLLKNRSVDSDATAHYGRKIYETPKKIFLLKSDDNFFYLTKVEI